MTQKSGITFPLSEMFASLQGEGIRTGFKTLFVRLAGCNFFEDSPPHPCKFCDASYAWGVESGNKVSLEDLETQIVKACTENNQDICLTGGEPLARKNVDKLIVWIADRYHLTVMTNGSLPLIRNTRAHYSMDIKCPASGNAGHTVWENLSLLGPKDQIKFVISNRDDFDYAKDIVHNIRELGTNIIFQPAWKTLPLGTLAKWFIAEKDIPGNVRIGVQLHKYIWPKKNRGV